MSRYLHIDPGGGRESCDFSAAEPGRMRKMPLTRALTLTIIPLLWKYGDRSRPCANGMTLN